MYCFLGIVAQQDQQAGDMSPSYILCQSHGTSDKRSGWRVVRQDDTNALRSMPKVLVTSLVGNEAMIDFQCSYRTRDHMHGDKRYSHEETKKYYPKGALCWFECNQYGEPLGTAIFIETVPRRKLVKERMSDFVNQVLADVKAPFHVNEAKTRYGSRKGSNWNLGVMLNKDNNITVGHMKKKHFKAALCNFICDYQHGKSWNPEEIMTLRGQLSYYRSVEADYFNYVVRHMNEKFHTDVERIMSLSLSPMQYLILHHKAQPGTPAVCDDIQTIVTIQV